MHLCGTYTMCALNVHPRARVHACLDKLVGHADASRAARLRCVCARARAGAGRTREHIERIIIPTGNCDSKRGFIRYLDLDSMQGPFRCRRAFNMALLLFGFSLHALVPRVERKPRATRNGEKFFFF